MQANETDQDGNSCVGINILVVFHLSSDCSFCLSGITLSDRCGDRSAVYLAAVLTGVKRNERKIERMENSTNCNRHVQATVS